MRIARFYGLFNHYGPDGALLGSNDAVGFGEVAVQATNSGTFLVVVGNNAYYSGLGGGTYLLTLAQTGNPIVVALNLMFRKPQAKREEK